MPRCDGVFDDVRLRPVVKWVGGKSRLLPVLFPLLPTAVHDYVEPFAGGMAMLLSMDFSSAVANDCNAELINLYEVVRDDVDALVDALRHHEQMNCERYFYEVRALDRDAVAFSELSSVERAARFVYLNKTAYNGLWRVNSRGEANAPWGRYVNPAIVDEPNLRAVSLFLQSRDVCFSCGDFGSLSQYVHADTFVYMDPPYDRESGKSSYVGYASGGFTREDQTRLRDWFVEMDGRGAKLMLSNSDTEFVRGLYKDYEMLPISAPRSVSCRGDGRGKAAELVIRNYG